VLNGERILIHGGETAVGQAAIRLAQHLGAEVHATVLSIESKAYLTQTFALAEYQVSLGLSEETDNSGFDMLLNCVPIDADTMRELWSSLSNFGRFVEIKDTDCNNKSKLDTTGLQKNRSFMSVDLLAIAVERPRLMERILSEITALVDQGVVLPIHITTFSISDVEQAFESLKHGIVNGKLVILPEAGAMVKVRAHPYFSEILSGANKSVYSGNSLEQRKEHSSTRCLIRPHWWYRWFGTKHGPMDGRPRSSKSRLGV
jgi:NADPH:quinone reductase-like Zn-dependent oxidoreductase